MKKFFLFVGIFISFITVQGQRNFYTILDSLYENDTNLLLPDSLKSGSVKNIDRMKEIWSPRLSPHGEVSEAADKIINYSLSFEDQLLNKSGASSANWTPEGPFGTVEIGDHGNGQINRITFDPKYNTEQGGSVNQTIYAGSFYGGLWRTEDGGDNWSVVNTDNQLPQTSVSGIAVSFQNSNHIFITTGRGDGRNHYKNESLGGTAMPIFTNGVYRSLDYGQSWEPINNGLLSHFTNGGTIRNIVIDSTDASTLYIVTTEGVFKSTNALSSSPSWTKLTVSTASGISEDFNGLEQHPTTASTIYAASNDIFSSTNSGSSWSSMTGSGTGLVIDSIPFDFIVKRIKLEVTPAAPDRLYAYINGSDTSSYNIVKNNKIVSVTGDRHPSVYIYMYKDSSWQQLHRIDLGQIQLLTPSWMGLAVSPLDPEKVYFSSAIVYGSNDITSQNFSEKSPYLSSGYHADTHELEFEPNTSSNPKLFSANHGGVSVKSFPSGNWEFINDGLNVALIWSFDVSKVNSDIRIIGRQDNGTDKFIPGSGWSYVSPADGYGAQIYNDNKGHRFVSNFGDGIGATNIDLPYDAIQVSHGSSITRREWIAKQFQIHEHPITNKPVFGFSELYTFPGQDRPSSVSSATDWTIESDLYREDAYINSQQQYIFQWPGSKRISEFAIAQSNPDNVYLATYGYASNLSETIFFRTVTGLKDGVYDDYNNPPLPPRTFLNVNEDQQSNLKSFITYNGQNYAPYVTGIAVNPSDENEVWISVSGFTSNLRVLKSSDGGVTWANADPTASLPEMPATNIVFQSGSKNRLYLATDVGVYVTDSSMNAWERFGDIPNVRVNELYIRYCNSKLYAGTYGRGIWSVDLIQDSISLSYFEIDSNTTWDENRFVDYSILVKSGNTLTLESTLYMPAKGRIIIEKGAELIVDGGIITNKCNNYWEGIEVRGDNNLDQSNFANQGVLILKNNAVIENAGEITILDNDNWDGGGIIQATDATFRNCKRAVSFYSYPYTNTSYFKHCTFELTPNFVPLFNLDTGYFPQVTLWDNSGVEFLGCEFIDNSGINEFDEYASIGIYSIDAAYAVAPHPTSMTRTTFRKFNYGVRAASSATSNTISIDGTDFFDNSIGVKIEALDQVRLSKNTINTGGLLKSNYPYLYQYGAQFVESSGYQIEENEFYENGSVMSTNGLNIINSGNVPNEVYRNTFSDLTIGQKYDGENKDIDPYIGLQFLCNTVLGENEFDVQVNGVQFHEGVRNYQGAVNPDISAGNTFSMSGANPEKHIQNNSGQVITYHYNGPPPEEPLLYTTSLVQPTQVSMPNNCPSELMQGFGAQTEGQETIEYYDELSQYNSLENDYNQAIDNGNTDSLLRIIDQYYPNEAKELSATLMKFAPYLSQEVLLKTAKSGLLNDSLLVELFLANPDATRSEAFLDYMQDSIPKPLSNKRIQSVYQNWDTQTKRTELEGKLASSSAKVGRLYNQLIYNYKSGQDPSRKDSIIAMYNSIGTIQAKTKLIEVGIEANNFDYADSLLKNLPSNSQLSKQKQAEYDNLANYVSIRKSIHAKNKNILQLNAKELNELRNIAHLNTGRTSQLAQNILCFGYQECKSTKEMSVNRKRSKRNYQDDLSNEKAVSNVVSIVPNPADREVLLTVEEITDNDKVVFMLHHINGKLVLERTINHRFSRINTSNLSNGTYLYSVYINGVKVLSDKLIIQH